MINGSTLRDCFISAAHAITNQREAVNELNVFPVPDGDTGTNMSMTINSAVEELEKLPDNCTVDAVATLTASALLRGARGNSGVILSLLFRGFARALANKQQAESADISFSLSKGVEYAYRAVMKPTEGTILTVARVAAQAAKDNCEKLDTTELWQLVTTTAQQTLKQTPELLPILKKAGVVDSGGQGLCCIYEAMLTVLKTGKRVELETIDAAVAPAKKTGVYADDLDPDLNNSYCTEFLVIKNENANYERLRAYLESVGDSVVCVDDRDIIKCHVHTATPGKVLGEALKHGNMSKIKIENMAEQYAARQSEGEQAQPKQSFEYVEPGSDEAGYGFVAVCAGDGVRSMFNDLGVDRIVSGGQTMNPSSEDIVEAVQSLGTKNIIVLANNKNIILAAQQAALLCDRDITVLPTRSIPEGISAMLAFDETVPLEQNVESMTDAAKAVATGEVTFASRDADIDNQHIKKGEILALVNGKLSFTAKSVAKAAEKLIRELASDDKSFVTIIYGDQSDEKQADKIVAAVKGKISSDIEISVVNGGMPVYYYYISVE